MLKILPGTFTTRSVSLQGAIYGPGRLLLLETLLQQILACTDVALIDLEASFEITASLSDGLQSGGLGPHICYATPVLHCGPLLRMYFARLSPSSAALIHQELRWQDMLKSLTQDT